MAGDGGITDLSIADLRARRSAKWTWYEPDVLPAWVAEMDFPLAPAISEALREAVANHDAGYASPDAAGLGGAFAGFAERRMGWGVDPERVTPVNDVVSGLSELVRVLTEPGAGVVITPPVYHPFFSLIEEAGRRVVEAPLSNGRELDLDAIERAFEGGVRVLILCNPHNPTGAVLTRSELARIAELAAAYDAWVLSDEIHAPLVLADAEHIPFTTVSDAAAQRGIVLSSASKAFNVAGLKCAVAVTASEAAAAKVAALPTIAVHVGHLGVLATVAAFESSDAWLDEVLVALDHNRALLAELLAEHLPQVAYEPPAAGYLAWLDCRALGLGDDPSAAFLERGRVALRAAVRYGGNGFARLNFATSPELMREAVARMTQALDG